MCKIFSLCVNKTGRIVGDGSIDSHTEMYKQNNIDDSKPMFLQNWCKVGITPIDGDIFNHKLSNWKLNIDEERTPDWWDKKDYEKLCFERLQNIFKDKKIFLINKKIKNLYWNCRFIKNTIIQKMYGSSTVQGMWGSSTVQGMYNSSTVQEMWGSSTVTQYSINSNIEKATGGSCVIIKRIDKVEVLIF